MKRLLIDRIILILILVIIAAACDSIKNSRPQPTAATTTAVPPTATAMLSPTAEPTATPIPIEAAFDQSIDLANFPPHAAIVIHFNQPMDVDSTDSPLSISPFRQNSFEWQNNNTTLIVTLGNGLIAQKEYEISLDNELKGQNGQPLAESFSWQLQTTFPPQAISRSPMVKDLTLWQPVIEIGFNKPMAKQSIPGALHISPELPFELSWLDNSNVEITLLEPLQFNATYEFTIDQSATDELGIPLLRDHTWSYRLKDIVKSKSGPAANAPDNPLTVSFNYEMDASQSLDGLALEPAIEGEWAWDEAHTALHFLPHTHYKPDATYTLSFNDPLITEDGTELPLLDPLAFTTSPAILEAAPEPGNVSPENAISIQFDRPMDPETTEAAFSISPDMAGSFTWEETTLYFYPDSGYLGEDQQYEVALAPTALAADGSEILDIPYSWTFTTTFFPEIASFGNGPNAQVLDANGRRAIHYVITRSLSRTLTFELYSLSLEQFLDRYAAGFSNIDQGNTISTEATELAYSWDVEPERLPDDYRNLRELIIPNDVPPGLYLLNLNAGWLDDQLILVLTNNTITVKQAEGQIMAWVTDINGRPVPGIEVGVYARDGHLLASDTADSRGIFRGTMPAFEEDAPPSVEPLIIVAQDGRDITASGLTTEWQLYAGSSYNWSQPNTQEYAAYIYTDRPIYRPGHTVFFKAIIRTDQDALLAVPPAGTPATVSIRDARNNAVQTMEMTTNDFGSLDGTFQLAEGATLGSYQIVVTLDNTVRRQRFKVEDYRKPDYEVSISTDAARYLAGDTITIVITAAYYFGEPVANAEISLVRFDLNGDYYSSEPQTIIGRTNADGIFTTTLPAETIFPNSPSSREGYPLSTNWGYEATVDDGSHQSVSSFKAIQVFDRTEYITFSTGSYLQQPGTPFNIVANISNIFGDPVGSRQLSVQLRRWSQENADYSTIVQSQTLITEEDGQGILPFTVEESGYYQLHVSGTDQTGETISYQTWVHVFSSQYNGWSGRQQNLKITADEESYAPGDTARLLIESTFSGPALLTMQRGTIQREMLVELTAPVTLVEVPIETTHVPNIHVIVHAWEEEDTTLQPSTYYSVPDSRLKTAYINLSVPATDKNLTVTVTPDREVYAPGSEATFTIEVTNYRGEPVSAELSLAMVDEAIFALSSELSGSLYNAFYYRRDNRVGTFHSLTLSRYLPIEEGGWGGGGEGGGGDGYSPGNPRSDFQDTAAWFPTLYTDADGRVQVTITLPDNLTSWRLTAKAATADTQIGQTTLNVLTQQPVIIQPLLPRTLTAGDTVGLSVMVHNYTESTQAIQVSVREADDSLLTFDTPLTQTITLPPDGLQIVGWTATAEEAGDATLIFAAAPVSSTIGGDAVQLPLTIRPLAIPNTETQVGEFNEQLATSVTIPADALPMSQVEIQLSRTIAGSLLEGLDYLTGFPYGCVEQTMSKALPNAVVGRALNQLGVSDPALQADLPAKINASIQRLYGFQHNDGGWGWWFDDETHDYQTAWVIFGLGTTAEAGYEIDPNVISRGVTWMNENLATMDIRTRAFALYSIAVAGQPNAEATLALYEQVDELDTFSQAALALTLHRLGELAEARDIIGLLAETAVSQNGFVHWDGNNQDGAYYSKTMASDVRSTALALSAFSVIEPGHPLEGGMVRWLMSQRQRQGWGTTNETSFAILGLTDHLLATSFSNTAAAEYTITLNGEMIAGGSLDRGEPAVTVIIPQEQLETGESDLVISKSGGGQLYYVVNTTVYLEQAEVEAAGQIEITREYLNPETNRPLAEFEAGQLVLVYLRVQLPENGSYMIIEDSLPGGLEALNERLNTTTYAADFNSFEDTPYYWQEYGYNHKEIFGDRVSFFVTEMEAGVHIISYLTRATRPGTFTAMPVESYAMYNLALWGRSASHMITVTEAGN